MISLGKKTFGEVWFVDFEFSAPSGERPKPLCLVAWELNSGRKLNLWEDELNQLSSPPYSIGRDSLLVAYYASAEMTCHLALGWELPENVLDLFTEFRVTTNGKTLPCGNGLLGALSHYGLPSIESVEKESMRDLAIRGGPFTDSEKQSLLAYCESDVASLLGLFLKMKNGLDIERGLIRGRYMKAAARIEHTGIPMDVEALKSLRGNWEKIQDKLIAKIDTDFNVFEGRTFKAKKFAQFLVDNDMSWPMLPSGKLAMDDGTFKDMAAVYPKLLPLRELRTTLSQMRLSEISVGKDGRNRCLLSAFRSRTGRNQPSNSKFIFGTAVWLRSLMKPKLGYGLAYLDWSQQEFGIAAALSQDSRMLEAYASGDPYLTFAKQAKAIPPNGTKHSHGAVRDQYKQCVLAVQYGMGALSLAARIGKSVAESRELLRIHKLTYPKFWRWSDAAVDHAMLKGYLTTTFGWTIQTGNQANERSLRNFPMQANGSEMLRLACSLATENGISVCAPVHDAILIEAPLDKINSVVLQTQEIMADASGIILDGFRLRSDAKLICYPDRYADERGKGMWEEVFGLIEAESKPVHGEDLSSFANEQVHVHTQTTDSSYQFLLGGS